SWQQQITISKCGCLGQVTTRRDRPRRVTRKPGEVVLGRAQRENGYLGSDPHADGRAGRAEAGMHVERRVPVAVEAEVEAVGQLAEAHTPREERKRDLASVGVPREHQ